MKRYMLQALLFSLSLSGSAFAVPGLALAAPASAKSDATARLLDRVALEDLLARYLYQLDHGQTANLADLFVQQGVLDVGSNGPITGREAIRAYYAARPTTRITRHVSTNLYLTFDDANHAHAVHTLTYYMGEGAGPFAAAPAGVADYAEKFERGADGQWRFVYRKPTPVFGTGSGPKPSAH